MNNWPYNVSSVINISRRFIAVPHIRIFLSVFYPPVHPFLPYISSSTRINFLIPTYFLSQRFASMFYSLLLWYFEVRLFPCYFWNDICSFTFKIQTRWFQRCCRNQSRANGEKREMKSIVRLRIHLQYWEKSACNKL